MNALRHRIHGLILFCLISFCISILKTTAIAHAQNSDQLGQSPSLRVYILAGQSNMEGQGVVDLDHPKYYNGGKGTLNHVLRDRIKQKEFAHLRDSTGNWTVRNDVFVRFKTRHGTKTGGLSIGFIGYQGKHHIGPELEFGNVVGDQFDEPVLLIKTAWGGKSLYRDFRSPSAGGVTGKYYKRMLEEIAEALRSLEHDFPNLKNHRPVLSGLVWFQGWNDMVEGNARVEYEDNLVHLINDMRKQLKAPHLPVVIGELGNLGKDAGRSIQEIRKAQAAVPKRDDLEAPVAFVETHSFHRDKHLSPNTEHGHHWFGNAESYLRIGRALGKKMIELETHSGQ